MARDWFRAVGAALVMLVLLVGLPVLLWVVGGSPIPEHLPSLDQVRTTLSMPDYTGDVLLGVLRYTGWAAWAIFAWAALTETVAVMRHRTTRPVRGLGGVHRMAAWLIAAVMLAGVAQTAMASSATALTPAQAAQAAQAAVPVAVAPAAIVGAQASIETPAPEAPAADTTSYTVREGDTLWGLATQHLGDGARWREIYDLNAGREMPGGYTLSDPGWLDPGWELLLPVQAVDTATAPEHTRTIQRGDTLSQIAADELGDANRYPEIFAASTDTVQPDGRHLVNPDLIYPGWEVTIPGTVAPEVQTGPGPETSAPGGTAGDEATPGVPTDAGAAADQSDASDGADMVGPGQTVAEQDRTEQASQDRSQTDQSAHQSGVQEWAPWVLAGLTGAGGVLAGSLWLALRARRREQWRHRRPGSTLAAPDPLLAPVEKTVVTVGLGTVATVEFLDAVLRRLGAVMATSGGPMPDLVAVELTGEHVVLHLGAPWQMGAPWEGSDGGHRWRIAVGVPLDQVGPPGDHPAPYPLLVTVGTSDDGGVWLFNMEDLAITLTGDTERARDFGRYLVAEIGCSPWAAWTTVDCVGLGAELVGLNPDRIRYHHTGDGDPVGAALAEAMATVGRATAAGADVVTARSAGVGSRSWSPQVLLVDATSDDPALDPLLDTVAEHGGQTGTSVVVAGTRPDTGGVRIEVGDDGRVRLPEVGLDLVAVGLDITEAAGCAGLVAHADLAVDPVPVAHLDDGADYGWQAWSDAAGALRPEHTVPRAGDSWCDPQVASSVLPAPDGAYVGAAATVPEELAALAPQVPVEVRAEVQAADPGLDEDLAAWYAPRTTRPRVRVLGPVQVVASGTAPARREPFFAELVAYLALRPHGTTPNQVAEAFSTSLNQAREYLQVVYQWLGANPSTGETYLYETDGVCHVETLVDLDLFRRLRVRGQARGADGAGDLLAALRLVAGRPFDDPAAWRPGSWAWLVEDRSDETAMVAVIDTAHTVVTGALAGGDLVTARWAAQTAQSADPDDEIIHLDLAAIASAEGRYAEAARIVADDIGNRSDDGQAPPEASTRTQEIVAAHPEWRAARAS